MKINNLDIISERLVPCVMNIIAQYYNDVEEIELDVPEDHSDYFVISINGDKYIIISKYEESSLINSCLDDDFDEWCTENRVYDPVRQYINDELWREDHMLDIEDILEGTYLTEFDRYNVYQCNN
jgi:hypothetical protein